MYDKFKLFLKWFFILFLLLFTSYIVIRSYVFIEYLNFSKYYMLQSLMYVFLIFIFYVLFIVMYKTFFEYDLNYKFSLKNDMFFKQIIINSTLILSCVLINYNIIIDKIVSDIYSNIEDKMLYEFKDKVKLENSELFNKFKIDKNNNDKYSILKYIVIYQKEGQEFKLKDEYINVQDNIYFEFLTLQKIKEKDEETSKYLDDILKDDFVSVKEYEDFKFFIKNKN